MNDELQHWGVLGMKWGRRKGSSNSQDHIDTRLIKKKKLSEMSNKELQTLTTRLQLERQYNELSPSASSKGKRLAVKALGSVGGRIATGVLSVAGTLIVRDLIGKAIKNPNLSDSYGKVKEFIPEKYRPKI